MTEAPRTRTRARPHTAIDASEQRSVRDTVSESSNTTHQPATSQEVHPAMLGGVPVMVARVRVSDGLTLNMGNYNSFRRDIGLELDTILPGPVGATLTDEQEAHLSSLTDNALDWVQEKLATAAADAQEYME